MARPITIDLAKSPMLCWRWLIEAPVAKADMRRRNGDDYAARVYVAFDMPEESLGAGTKLKIRIARGIFGKARSEEHTSELQSLMRISYAVFCLKKKKNK